MTPPTKPTSTERVAKFRARKAQAGEIEVRGIFARPELHAAIKAAAKLIKKPPA